MTETLTNHYAHKFIGREVQYVTHTADTVEDKQAQQDYLHPF